jgi:hypothetical protein
MAETEAFLQCKYLAIPAAQLAGACLACAEGHWVQLSSELPTDAEYAGSWYDPEDDTFHLFFYHPSFPTSPDVQSVPELSAVTFKAAERAE